MPYKVLDENMKSMHGVDAKWYKRRISTREKDLP
jgi:hypothetical protein